MSYEAIKQAHVLSVATSFTLFFLRGYWVLQGSAIMQQRWVRIAPHMVDTVLLGSAIWLAVLLNASPLEHPWLMAKIVALLIYIALGSIAIKRGKTKQIRTIAWITALLTFLYIVSVALTKTPLPWTAF